MLCAPACEGVVGEIIIVNYTNAWFSINCLDRADLALFEVMQGPKIVQVKHVRVADSHAQFVVNQLLVSGHPVKGYGGVDGGSCESPYFFNF